MPSKVVAWPRVKISKAPHVVEDGASNSLIGTRTIRSMLLQPFAVNEVNDIDIVQSTRIEKFVLYSSPKTWKGRSSVSHRYNRR